MEKILYERRGGALRFALIYPNSYKVGMSNLGIHLLSELLNRQKGVACERIFLSEGTPRSIETSTPLNKFQVLGFALSFEEDYFNVIKMLRRGKVAVKSCDRGEAAPLVIAGGPCATINPEPLTAIFDAFIIGEGEETLPEVLALIISTKKLPRSEVLEKLSAIAGVYVPARPRALTRRWVKDLDKYPCRTTILPQLAALDMYLLETGRGCARYCRFCVASHCLGPVRYRDLHHLKKEVDRARLHSRKIGLMGAAVTDHPNLKELVEYIGQCGLKLSVASLRADKLTVDLARALKAGGLQTLTLAPEAGTERLRRLINKGLTEEDILRAIRIGKSVGIWRYRLYFMIGLPGEELSDVAGIISLTQKIKALDVRVKLSVNEFIPKAGTPFQAEAYAGRDYINAAIKILRKNLRGEELQIQSRRLSEVQAILSRAGRELSLVMAQSESPAQLLANLKAAGLSAKDYWQARSLELPWQFINFSGG